MTIELNPETGYYGQFGGAFVPEMLYPNVRDLAIDFEKIKTDAIFQATFHELLRDFAGRETPLYFAERMSEKYHCEIWLKREDLMHTGAHKINNTVGQVLLAKQIGKKRIIAETGAGQHGVATAAICAKMGLECIVYMGKHDMERQAPNVARMKMLGAKVVPAESGSQTLKDATNEAIRDWINNPTETHYVIGSVVGPHPYPSMVAYFQSVISEEIKRQMPTLPDYVIACVGGGSNAAGAFYHFIPEPSVKLIGVEAAGKGLESGFTAASLVKGKSGIIHGSLTYLMQTSDGQIVEPYSVSAGLDYPGIGPLHAYLYETKRATYLNATDEEALAAVLELSRLEGIIPALETAHALAVLPKMNLQPQDKVVICLSGRGDKDLNTYMKYFDFEG